MSMKIFACGGAGINLASHFEQYRGSKDPGFSEFDVKYIDTSRSNLSTVETDKENIYLIDGADGSGKKRDENYAAIAERSQEILHHFKPGDVNIVIHSLSGGSGSVIGPVLVSELLNRALPVITVIVGSSDSRKELENTIKSIQSYETIAKKREAPVVAVYFENNKETPRGTVDQKIYTTVVILSAFFSKENHELDSMDLFNFLNFHRVTSFTPRLAYLELFDKEITIERDHSLVSVATLSDIETPTSIDHPVEYQAVGFVHDSARNKISVPMPIHAAIIAGVFNDIMGRLNDKLKVMDESRKARVDRTISLDGSSATDEGVIL